MVGGAAGLTQLHKTYQFYIVVDLQVITKYNARTEISNSIFCKHHYGYSKDGKL